MSRAGILGCALLTVLLSGCASTPPPQGAAVLTFAHLPAIRLAVASLTVDERWSPPLRAPYVGHLLPTTVMQATRSWLDRRIIAAGMMAGIVRITITEASIREEPLGGAGGLSDFFTVNQDIRYRGRIALEVTVRQGRRDGGLELAAQRSITTPENASIAEREDAQMRLVEQMIEDLHAALEAGFRERLGPGLLLQP